MIVDVESTFRALIDLLLSNMIGWSPLHIVAGTTTTHLSSVFPVFHTISRK